MRMLSVRSSLLAELEQDCLLDEPDRLLQRIEAQDRLDVHFPQDSDAGSGTEAALECRARAIQARLDAVNRELYEGIRSGIQQGAGQDRVLAWSRASGHEEGVAGRDGSDRYDYLDELVSGILQLDQPDDEAIEVAPEMVFYQPTPARVIFDLIERLELTGQDVLIDLGSGLGHLPLLAAICTSASCIGIELEAVYVDCAQSSAHALNLTRVTFIQQDARAADLSSGTVFYLYTPFTGTILRAVLDSLRHEASSRAIRVCAFGPCVQAVATEPWLQAIEPQEAHRAAIFRSV
ncbi:class I SAM-dependent methyltransferase [Rhodanobacter sp. C01]|uniref:class I SAM-dependent methyltransferase n=1 Tax=Rhodanobacter sp. C01 TaxID=1945856 RepID=UPI000986F772|nr:class I SAM-dependent methyltransferase [Rhodanobacter sp. C01]OOG49059.1 hypothetical protein B0E50_06555 [Rhodanobacter sp. C01]